jgi:hypothetical protein
VNFTTRIPVCVSFANSSFSLINVTSPSGLGALVHVKGTTVTLSVEYVSVIGVKV